MRIRSLVLVVVGYVSLSSGEDVLKRPHADRSLARREFGSKQRVLFP